MPELLRRMVADDPTRPRLTWYGPRWAVDGERVELSARNLDMWVAKTANLLVEEFDAGPGTTLALALPVHWRTVVWQLAAWSVGATVVVDDGGMPDVHVTADAQEAARAAVQDTVLVALEPLARSFPGGAPAGTVDYAGVVTGYGDVFRPTEDPDPQAPALLVPGARTTFAELLPSALGTGAAWPVGVRLLSGAGPRHAVEGVLAAFVRGGSVVLTPDLAALPAAVREQELVTAELPARG
ncbi:TIGR03089 family protein [Kineococcus sp. NUM-3379]